MRWLKTEPFHLAHDTGIAVSIQRGQQVIIIANRFALRFLASQNQFVPGKRRSSPPWPVIRPADHASFHIWTRFFTPPFTLPGLPVR